MNGNRRSWLPARADRGAPPARSFENARFGGAVDPDALAGSCADARSGCGSCSAVRCAILAIVVAGVMAIAAVVVAGALGGDPPAGPDAGGGAGGQEGAGSGAPVVEGAASVRGDGQSKIGGSFVRRGDNDRGDSILEVASKRYRKPGEVTEVALVGVVHIGTNEFYRAMEAHLAQHGLVLYESVTPRGAGADGASDGGDPLQATRDSMLFLRRVMLALRDADAAALERGPGGGAKEGASDAAGAKKEVGAKKDGAKKEVGAKKEGATTAPAAPPAPWPSIADAVARAHTVDSRFAPWAAASARDAWGRPLEAESMPDGSMILISRGADGKPGGEGADADVRLRTPADRRSKRSADEALQPQLASMLGLAFQLEAVDYHHDAWVVADMGERQLLAELAERGIDGSPFMQTLSGASMSAGLAHAAIGLIRFADGLSGGKVRAFVILALVETLANADDRIIARGLPKGFAEVILHRRNDVVFEALASRLARAPAPESIAIFYGAAHMPDLERRLVDDGWQRVSERWFPAMSINPAAAGLDEELTAQLREGLREMLQEMGGSDEQP